jgi:dihydrofolate synthase/folylpolyglutamate synthase
MPRPSAVDFILDLEIHGIKLGLEKVRLLLREVGSPERRYPCVLVAGTNGKGSVTAIVAEALTRAGYRCGRYTSPHLVDLRERICINDRPIPRPALERGAALVRRSVRRLLRSGRLDAPCTFFEATTALALDYFARRRVDVALLEVGMGGRFDATNAVEPVLSIITNIELDHERWLGTTRAAIAREKAGIARSGSPLVVGPTCDESLAVIRA